MSSKQKQNQESELPSHCFQCVNNYKNICFVLHAYQGRFTFSKSIVCLYVEMILTDNKKKKLKKIHVGWD